MVDQFITFVRQHHLFSEKDNVLLAVSGGMDSMTLLHLFQEAGFTNMGVAHCNFQLRGDASDGDEQFVVEYCNRHQIPVHTRRFDTATYAWDRSLSIQMAARELRYKWFHDLSENRGYQCIATAHQFDDTIETILLKLARGGGIEAAAGIPLRNGNVVRPMLFASRRQIERYVRARSLLWREDVSNDTDVYQRNFIRHQIIPKLRQLNPSLEKTWQEGIEKINYELGLVNSLQESWMARFVRELKGRVVVAKAAVDLYTGNPALLWRFIRNYGFNFEQAVAIQTHIHAQPGKRYLSPTHLLVIDRTDVIIVNRQWEWMSAAVESPNETVVLGPWTMLVDDISFAEQSDDKPDANIAVVDGELLNYPLTWRRWKPGDYFYPLGFGHRKKLSDYFIDEKVSVADKEQATVLESRGEIVWIPGYRADDRFKITSFTRHTIRFRINDL